MPSMSAMAARLPVSSRTSTSSWVDAWVAPLRTQDRLPSPPLPTPWWPTAVANARGSDGMDDGDEEGAATTADPPAPRAHAAGMERERRRGQALQPWDPARRIGEPARCRCACRQPMGAWQDAAQPDLHGAAEPALQPAVRA